MKLGYDINILSKQSNIIEIITASATDPEFIMRVGISLEKEFILIFTYFCYIYCLYFSINISEILSN